MPRETYATLELCEAAGVTFRQADHWTRLGLLEPDERAEGKGNVRYYAASEVDVARALGRISRAFAYTRGGEVIDRRPQIVEALRDGGRVFELEHGISLDLDKLAREVGA